MDAKAPAPLRIGAWRVDPTAGQISRGGETVRLEARTMRLLLDLAEHAGEVVSIDGLLDRVWAGVIVTPDSVYQAVASLRRLLGDDPKRPSYIATVPRLGYRLVAKVGPWREDGADAGTERIAATRWPRAAAILGLVIVAGIGFAGYQRWAQARAPIAVGVMAFLDLTPSMDQEILADDVTEGLADRLAKEPRIKTPDFRASFLLKGKHKTPQQAAQALGVAYVVSGTVRKEGERVLIKARLVRGDTGFVAWTQTYDTPLADVATTEAAIAAGAAQAAIRPPRG